MKILNFFKLTFFCALLANTFFSNVAHSQSRPDVVIMIDLTGSTSLSDLEIEKNAAKTLLQSFLPLSPRPRVAIGTFNLMHTEATDASESARILPGGELTDVYGSSNSNTGLFKVINNLNYTNGFTDIAAAISVAQAHLNTLPPSGPRFIVLISDGTANRPGQDSYMNCDNCGCPNAFAAANVEATAAESAGTKIVGIHYAGNGGSVVCSNEPAAGYQFMQQSIATTPALFFQGNSDLSGVFQQIACAVTCDDGNSCTNDSCNASTGACEHTAVTSDLDNDGVVDCVDQCFGNDNALGQACSFGTNSCQTSGTWQCSREKKVTCIGQTLDPVVCFACTSSDQSSTLLALNKARKSAYGSLVKLFRRLAQLSKKDNKTKQLVATTTASTKAMNLQGTQNISLLPPTFYQCANQERCITTYENAKLDQAALELTKYKSLASAFLSRIRHKTRTVSKADRTLNSNVAKAFKDGTKALAKIPKSRNECQ
jgi:hypothetical protein